MTNLNFYELAIIAFILAGIGYVVFRGGAANPESTGSLGRKIDGLSASVGKLSTRVGHVETELGTVKQDSASTADIERLEAKIDGKAELAERTWRSVDRIERIIIEKGLGK